MTEKWRTYEAVAAYILGLIKSDLGLAAVEGKQKLVGHQSGTEWEVDAKGVSIEGEGFVIIECKRTPTAKQSQETLGALAYRIQDTGAVGGIVVSPEGLQVGAQKVASAENIVHVEIDANSTPENFCARFLNNLFVGMTFSVQLGCRFEAEVRSRCASCGCEFSKNDSEKVCHQCS